jgi:NitT/TauT family transport system substrate-binding protein
MNRKIVIAAAAFAGCLALLSGCPTAPSGKSTDTAKGTGSAGNLPSFSLAWSEYPSWSVFDVASQRGLINGEKGKTGRLEERWGVDIELKGLEYVPCINAYSDKTCDAVCMTNMDALAPSLGRKSVAIMPTSTSDGADALIVEKGIDAEKLKGVKVRGASESVSDYAFYRLLELNKLDPSKYQFENLDPAEATKLMEAKKVPAIMVWNPFVLQTLRKRGDEVEVLFDSSKIPGEIIDMVVVGDDVLKKPGGKEFANCIIQTFYEFSKMLDDPKQRDQLLVDLGKKFSSLDAKDMATCCEKTKFYKDADAGLGLFQGDKLPKAMETIVKQYQDRKILKDKTPKIAYGTAEKAGDADLRFDPSYIQAVKGGK